MDVISSTTGAFILEGKSKAINQSSWVFQDKNNDQK